ncbi:MAG: PEP-CTERM sorting domain-containing protein [Phycisphaerae bacterium]|nr:PEP-CTERM sorting domain-containing protein [Phycisphaerae bacterium]
MRERICTLIVSLLFVCAPATASLIAYHDYTLTFERQGWSESRLITAAPFPMSQPFYQVGGQDVDVYMEKINVARPGIVSEYTWYVNAPAVRDDPDNLMLLGGSGPLTIRVSGMRFYDSENPSKVYTTNDDLDFVPLVTHIYYVGFQNGEYIPMHLPGDIPVNPGSAQWQRSPVAPLIDGVDPEFATYGAAYGTPYQDYTQPGISFVLPDMYVPDNMGIALWELSFGAGFAITQDVPEPSVISLLVMGLTTAMFRRRRTR